MLLWVFLDLVYLYLCLRQDLFMSDVMCLWFAIIIPISIIINHLVSFKADKIFLHILLYYIQKISLKMLIGSVGFCIIFF